MLREADCDAVAVCVPNDLHAEVSVAALRAKKHVLVEKPMATTLAEADAMLAAARASRRLLMVEHAQRFDPAHAAARELLRRGRIGRITGLQGRIGHAGPEYWAGTRSGWFVERRRSGGGALMDIGAHIVDLLLWLSAKRPRRVCCTVRTVRKRIAVEDNAAALLEFSDGTIGSFEASWTTQPYEVRTTFWGERGILRTTLGQRHPVVVEDARRIGDPNHRLGPPRHPPLPRSIVGAYGWFVEAIAGRRPPVSTGGDGRAALEVLLACYRSARLGRWIDLPMRG